MRSSTFMCAHTTWWQIILNVITALHGMQTRSSDENSVCLSVRPSVYQTRGL